MPKRHKTSKRHSLGFVRSEKHHQREVERKAKKLASKQPKAPMKLHHQDPQLPNLDPQKQEILRKLMQREKVTSSEMQQALAQRFARDVVNYQTELNNAPVEDTNPEDKYLREKNLKKRQFKQILVEVVQSADVIIEVLDARDPEGTRNTELEQNCAQQKKPVILLLNKIDLVPAEVLAKYLQFYRKLNFPTILFKAPQIVAERSVRYANAQSGLQDKSACVGAIELKKLIHDICPNERVIAGICGVPNTGKSSIINALANRQACQAAPQPGVTREMREIHVDKRLRLLDSPGVVADTRRNVILREELLENPVGEIGRLLQMVFDIQQVYSIYEVEFAAKQTIEEQIQDLLIKVGKKTGRIHQGGIVNQEEVAVQIIRDWNRGLIPFWKELEENQAVQLIQQAQAGGVDCNLIDEFNYDVLGHLVGRGGIRLK